MLDFLGRRGRIVIVLTLLLAGGGVVIFLHAILFPFLLAGFLSYVLAPVIHRMHQWKIRGYQMPRGMAVILIYLLILFILSSGGSYLIPRVTAEMGRLTEEFPKAVSTFNQQWIPEINRRLNEWASKLPESPKPPEPAANAPVETPAMDQPIPEPNGELEQLMEHYTFERSGSSTPETWRSFQRNVFPEKTKKNPLRNNLSTSRLNGVRSPTQPLKG